MKKSKLKFISNKKVLKIVIAALAASIVFVAGYWLNVVLNGQNDKVLVWAVDDTVKIPDGLEGYLMSESKDDCMGYRGTDSPTGVTLYAVEKSVGDWFAAMSTGCSDMLAGSEFMTVAMKKDGKWTLTQPIRYFNSTPDCEQLQKYSITKDAEPECWDGDREIQDNSL